MSDVANFLADLYDQGYQYRSINSYRSAIASAHDRVEGMSVGQLPVITRLMAGIANSRPPQPRYTVTWDINIVLKYLENLGDNQALSLKILTLKTAMLLALTRPSRSADLHSLDTQLIRSNPEGISFRPSKPPKQTKAAKIGQEFFFPKYEENQSICPVRTLNHYLSRTETLRERSDKSQLFISFIKPHNPVSSATIARWLKLVLELAGIDTSIFKAHSTRGASTSAAAQSGVTTNDILLAADWNSESVFCKFYYKPIHNDAYGKGVLSHSK